MSKVTKMVDKIDWAKDNRRITLDLSEIEVEMGEDEREVLTMGRTIHPVRNLMQQCIMSMMQAKYSGGMKRAEGKFWAPWQPLLSGTENLFSIPRGCVSWMHAQLVDENLQIPYQVQNARESLITYLEDKLQPAQPESAA